MLEIDPVLARGREAVLPFDWNELSRDDPAAQAFFDDAADHDVGRNGLAIPIRNRKGVRSLVCFTSNHSEDGWAEYKSRNIMKLQPMAVLINSAARINFKLTPDPVELSKREEECLIWAARGKTYHDIAGILNLSFASVKTYLDTARHKLSCINLTHAVAVAIATGVIRQKSCASMLELVRVAGCISSRPLRSWMSRATTASETAPRRPLKVAMTLVSLSGVAIAARKRRRC